MRDVLLIIPGFSSTALALTEAVKGSLHGFMLQNMGKE
jgi:hypothetical protein